MLHLANVRAGARVLVVDDCKGLLVGACLERMNGQGVVLAFQHSKETHFEAVQFLNLPEQARSILYPFDWKHKNFDPLPVIAGTQTKKCLFFLEQGKQQISSQGSEQTRRLQRDSSR